MEALSWVHQKGIFLLMGKSVLLTLALLRSAHITSTQLASGFLVNAKREGLSSFTLDDVVANIYRQAIKLAKAGRNVDQNLLIQHQARKRAKVFWHMLNATNCFVALERVHGN